MSEYQYYEFQAVDRPLTRGEMAELRTISTRARITPTRFQNVYSYGDFRGDPLELMTRYFDAFVYVANWGTHKLMLRLPRDLLDPLTARPYAVEYSCDMHARGDQVILDFDSEGEEDGEIHWITDEEAEAWLPALLPLRAELAQGDRRALYLGWLAATVTLDDLEEVEPPVPPGLGDLSPALRTLAAFLRIDEDLLAIAAAASPKLPEEPSAEDLQRWIAALPGAEKDALLLQLANDAARARAGLWQRFRQETAPPARARGGARTVAQLQEAAEARAVVRRRDEAKREAAAQARRERAAAAAREAYLDSIAGQEEALWGRVETLIAAMQAKEYDQAVHLLIDLRDLSARGAQTREFAARLGALRERYAKRRGLIDRLNKAELRA